MWSFKAKIQILNFLIFEFSFCRIFITMVKVHKPNFSPATMSVRPTTDFKCPTKKAPWPAWIVTAATTLSFPCPAAKPSKISAGCPSGVKNLKWISVKFWFRNDFSIHDHKKSLPLMEFTKWRADVSSLWMRKLSSFQDSRTMGKLLMPIFGWEKETDPDQKVSFKNPQSCILQFCERKFKY